MTDGYLLDNASELASIRFECLSALYDPVSIRAFDAIGVAPGWHCLDVGTGNGSIARHLASRVGPDGAVVATDIDTRWVEAGPDMPNLLPAFHDVTRDSVPFGAYDLIHARLVLMHLPERDEVLSRLVAGLKPGGWLVVGELDPITPYMPSPVTAVHRLVNRVGEAFTAALASRGADNTTGWRLAETLSSAGLRDVDNRGDVAVALPGSPAARLMATNVEQVAEELVAGGAVTPDDISRYLNDIYGVPFLMPVFFCARGRRP